MWEALLIRFAVALGVKIFGDYVAPKLSPTVGAIFDTALEAAQEAVDGPENTNSQDEVATKLLAAVSQPPAKAKAKLAAADPGS